MHIEPQSGYLHVQVSGAFDESKAQEFIRHILKAIDQYRIFKVFVDIRDIEGPISMTSRFSLATYLATQETSRVQMAVVESPGQVEDPKFFENVAVNRGFRVKVFTTSTSEALEWLAGGPADKPTQGTVEKRG
jgi:hypothetical protein